MAQNEFGQAPANAAIGNPNCDTSGLPDVMLEGIAPLAKNQVLIALDVHSMAYTPPRLALNLAP